MGFTIRKAERKDAPGIARVHVESWRTTYADLLPQTFLASLDVEMRAGLWREQIESAQTEILVAEQDAEIVGFVSGGRWREPIERYDSELYAIYLLREHQGRGIGRAMFCALVRLLREENFRAMIVLVLEKNTAVSFYAHLGATPMGQKSIVLGGVALIELIYAWPNLDIAC